MLVSSILAIHSNVDMMLGMQTIPHTQTAINNFLGMHRYDAQFQIMVGAWTNPANHSYYANGNVLTWAQLLPYRRKEQLPDNFGIDWASGCYGGEMIVHVQVTHALQFITHWLQFSSRKLTITWTKFLLLGGLQNF
eukprot:SAG31_NODE_8184_length_1501_cov_1.594151_3_plen_136_part_00